ncbi:hypothetical protein D1816_08695 [Aquimarina sp. AD10]|uniref:hypothetical protein n=1 Tax=Aquimarina sp. AD10 TaxID=1714849 RepID=UPI000E4C47DB|nr:hypothetical protein [Aquimarina sp. AD10]AXT60425.1 hypothetical protein D1816_08695 [Aquimarina sp. AD10]RKN01141.1 hypothetical protein D7033_04790 [Aquimarina sp. AD10]
MKILKYIYIALAVLTPLSCSNSDDGDNEVSPEKVSLIFPDNGKECTTGVFLENSTDSNVIFRWSNAPNATSYEVTYTNTSVIPNSVEKKTFTTNEGEITLKQDTNYSWTVTSIRGTKKEVSDEWTFYNSAKGETNFAPLPVKLIAPEDKIELTTIVGVLLEWEKSELINNEDDIESYTVHLSTSKTFIENETETLLPTTGLSIQIPNTVNMATTYYWKVVTKDTFGNETESQAFSFKTL